MNRPILEHDDVTVIEDGQYTYAESDESAAFREFKTSFDDEKMGTLRVHRVPESKTVTNKASLKTRYLFSCTIDQFDFDGLLEYLRDHYGGGTYRLIGSRAGHAGVSFNRLVEIEAPIDRGFMGAMDKNDPLRRTENSGDIIGQVGAVLLESQTRMEELFRDMQGPRTGGDAFDQMTKMATAMGTMMQNFAPQNQQPSIGSQIKEMVLLQEFMQNLRGDSGGDSGEANIYSMFTETIRQFGGPIAAAMAAGQQSGAINSQGVLEHKPEPEKSDEEKQQEKEMEQLKTQVKFILANAEAGADPKKFAEIVVEKTPEDMIDKLYDFLSQDDCIEQIIAINPEVEKFKNWFTVWRDHVLFLLTEPVDEPIVAESETVAGDSDSETVAGDTGSDISDKSNGDTGENT